MQQPLDGHPGAPGQVAQPQRQHAALGEPADLQELREELIQRSVPVTETWWGYDSLQVTDPDGNELLFPISD